MEQMNLQELIGLIIVVELFTTLLKMLNLVETSVLDFWGQTLLYSTACYISNKHSRSVHATDVLLKRGRHKLYTALS